MEDVPSIDFLEANGACVTCTTEPQVLLDGAFYVSGEIPRVTPFEVGFPTQYRRTQDGSGWEHDPLIMDERFVAVNVDGKGLYVFSACSHAGIINVLQDARERFPDLPL
jgi:7,8-dihydropterin-6-yl-methyl-4-(beta-D-ribofuranosyl)aminobenzene 5'-phosphate synthase